MTHRGLAFGYTAAVIAAAISGVSVFVNGLGVRTFADPLTNLRALQWNEGAVLIALSTVLFAIDFVIAKHLLRGVSTVMVLTARMTMGTAMLLLYALAAGRLVSPTELNPEQWRFVLVTGLSLLLFTATTFTAIRYASVSAVLAIGSAAPIITTLLQVVGTGGLQIALVDVIGLVITGVSVVVIVVIGLQRERYGASQVLATEGGLADG